MTLDEAIKLIDKRVAEEREAVLNYLLEAQSNNLLTYEAIKRGDHRKDPSSRKVVRQPVKTLCSLCRCVNCDCLI